MFRQISFIGDPLAAHEDQIGLGYKGYSLKRLRALGLRVPDGFVVSTDLLASTALDDGDLAADVQRGIRDAVCRLEEITGAPARRSRSAVAALGPLGRGLLDARDDGHDPQRRTEPGRFSARCPAARRPSGAPGTATGDTCRMWPCRAASIATCSTTSWSDSRNVTGWSGSWQFTPLQMREIALAYREAGSAQGVEFDDEPVEQLMQAVALVARSWDVGAGPAVPPAAPAAAEPGEPRSSSSRWCSAT